MDLCYFVRLKFIIYIISNIKKKKILDSQGNVFQKYVTKTYDPKMVCLLLSFFNTFFTMSSVFKVYIDVFVLLF